MNPENPNEQHANGAASESANSMPSSVTKPPTPSRTPPKPKRKHNRAPMYAAVIGVLGLAMCGILPRIGRSRHVGAVGAATRDELPVVSTVSLHREADSSDVSLPANLQAIEQTTINAQTMGYLKQRFVDIGSAVKAGDVLAVVESPELDQQVSQSQAEVAKSQADLGHAQADSARYMASISEAQSEESRSRADITQAQADLAHLHAKEVGAQAALNVAKAKQAQASQQYDEAVADVKRAKSGMDIARKTLARWKELEKGNAVSGQEVDEKQADYDSSVAQVEAANAAVTSAAAQIQAAKESVGLAAADLVAAHADVQSGAGRVSAAKSAFAASQSSVQAAVASYRAGESTVTSADASIRETEANARRVQALQSYERIVAPFSGVITARNVDVGDLVSPSPGGSGASDQMKTVTKSGLFGLAKTDVLLAQVNVPEDSVSMIHEGQDADLTTTEYPSETFHGTVFQVSGALDATSRTLLVEVKVPNPKGLLKPGMYASIRFLGSKGASTLRIPSNALVFDENGTRVAILTVDNKIHFVKVVAGKDFGDQIEVLQGLKGDETIVTNVDSSLQEGMTVKPVAAPQQGA